MFSRLILSGVVLGGLITSPVLAIEANTKPAVEKKASIAPSSRTINPVTRSAVTRSKPGGERSIIIVSGKNAKSESAGSPGSKVMLNPQPLPPKASSR